MGHPRTANLSAAWSPGWSRRNGALLSTRRWDCKQSIERGIGATIDGVRGYQPTVPLAVVTPTVAYYEVTTRCRGGYNLEQLREQIRAAVRVHAQDEAHLAIRPIELELQLLAVDCGQGWPEPVWGCPSEWWLPRRCVWRSQVRARVARGDARLYLIEGKPLVPQSLQTDSLHPSTQGVRPC